MWNGKAQSHVLRLNSAKTILCRFFPFISFVIVKFRWRNTAQCFSAYKTIDPNVIVVYGKVFIYMRVRLFFLLYALWHNIDRSVHDTVVLFFILSFATLFVVLFCSVLFTIAYCCWFYFLWRFFLHSFFNVIHWKDFGTTVLGYISFTLKVPKLKRPNNSLHIFQAYFDTNNNIFVSPFDSH